MTYYRMIWRIKRGTSEKSRDYPSIDKLREEFMSMEKQGILMYAVIQRIKKDEKGEHVAAVVSYYP